MNCASENTEHESSFPLRQMNFHEFKAFSTTSRVRLSLTTAIILSLNATSGGLASCARLLRSLCGGPSEVALELRGRARSCSDAARCAAGLPRGSDAGDELGSMKGIVTAFKAFGRSRDLRSPWWLGSQEDEENRLRGVSLPACDHSAGRLAVFSIHFELPRC